MDITLQGMDKLSLTKRVIELEKKGWICISRITPVTTFTKHFDYKSKGINQNDKRAYNRFNGTDGITLWKCKMRKEDKD